MPDVAIYVQGKYAKVTHICAPFIGPHVNDAVDDSWVAVEVRSNISRHRIVVARVDAG